MIQIGGLKADKTVLPRATPSSRANTLFRVALLRRDKTVEGGDVTIEYLVRFNKTRATSLTRGCATSRS